MIDYILGILAAFWAPILAGCMLFGIAAVWVMALVTHLWGKDEYGQR